MTPTSAPHSPARSTHSSVPEQISVPSPIEATMSHNRPPRTTADTTHPINNITTNINVFAANGSSPAIHFNAGNHSSRTWSIHERPSTDVATNQDPTNSTATTTTNVPTQTSTQSTTPNTNSEWRETPAPSLPVLPPAEWSFMMKRIIIRRLLRGDDPNSVLGDVNERFGWAVGRRVIRGDFEAFVAALRSYELRERGRRGSV